MASLLWKNNASTTLAGGINTVVTTVSLAAGSGVLFPAPGTGQSFKATFTDAATGLLNEIVKVTNVTGDVATIVRAQEGTVAQSWNAGDNFSNLVTAGAVGGLAQIATFAGNPNGVVTAGQANEQLWDSTHNILWVAVNAGGTLWAAASGTPTTQFSAQNVVPNTNTPIVIANNCIAGLYLIYNDDGAGNAFSDLITYYQFASSIGVLASAEGTPGARTYTSASGTGKLNLALNGGSAATIRPTVVCIGAQVLTFA